MRDGGEAACISPGHLTSVEGAARWARACTAGEAWPLPLKLAHRKAEQARRAAAGRPD